MPRRSVSGRHPSRAAGSCAAAAARRRCLDDRIDTGAFPVPAVDVAQHGDVALRAEFAQDLTLVVLQRRRRRRVRRPDEVARLPGGSGDRQLGLAQLVAPASRRDVDEIGVAERVDPDLGPGCPDPADQFGVFGRVRAEHEERRGHAVALQDVEDPGSPLRVGPVVERQRDGPVGHGQGSELAVRPVQDRAAVEDGVRYLRRAAVTDSTADVDADVRTHEPVGQQQAPERPEYQREQEPGRPWRDPPG